MFNKLFAVAIAVALFTGHANASTLRLDGYTAPVQNVRVGSSPVSGTPSHVGATGFSITDISGSLGSFTAWCLDISHRLMGVGQSQSYSVTSNPYSNSYGLSNSARNRVQSVFDANYASLNLTNGDQAAGFQMALWEAAYEKRTNPLSVSSGLFRASSTGSTSLANQYLSNAANYTGNQRWNLSFLQVSGYGPNRGVNTGQNLVTVSPVPLPAAGLLLLTALAGTGVLARRRRKA